MHTYNDKSLKQKRRHLRNNMTEQEIILWSYLRKRQLLGLKFIRQYSVDGFILDFYCPRVRLAIEVDGSHHAKQKEYDNERTKYLKSINIEVLRFWNSEISSDISKVLDRIELQVKRLMLSANLQ